MKDFFDSLRQQIGDRMSSPIFGSFLISWVCWNHRYLFVLFSDEPIADRLSYAATIIYSAPYVFWTHILVWPILCSLGYIVLYPRISKPLLIHWDRQQKELLDLRNEAQKRTLLTKEDSQKIILDALEQRSKFEETLARQARELEAIKNTPGSVSVDKVKAANEQILALELELQKFRSGKLESDPLDRFSQEMRKGIQAVMSALAKVPGQILRLEGIGQRMNTTPLKTRVYVDNAIAAGLVEWGDSSQGVARLTEGGRAYALKEGWDG